MARGKKKGSNKIRGSKQRSASGRFKGKGGKKK